MYKSIILSILILFSLNCLAQNSRYYKNHRYYSELKSVPFIYVGVPITKATENHHYQPLLFVASIPYNLQIYDKGNAAIDLILEPQFAMVNIYDQSKMESEFGISIGIKPRFRVKRAMIYFQPTAGAQYVTYESEKIDQGLNLLLSEVVGVDLKIKNISLSSQFRYRHLINNKQGSNNILLLLGVGYSF